MTDLSNAIDAMNSREGATYLHVAREFGVDRHTLARHHQRKQQSNHDATFEHRSLLTEAQENGIISYINLVCSRGFPPTPAMVRTWVHNVVKKAPREY